MEAMIVYLLLGNLFLLAVSGILFTAAINYYRDSARVAEETRKLALRVLLRNRSLKRI